MMIDLFENMRPAASLGPYFTPHEWLTELRQRARGFEGTHLYTFGSLACAVAVDVAEQLGSAPLIIVVFHSPIAEIAFHALAAPQAVDPIVEMTWRSAIDTAVNRHRAMGVFYRGSAVTVL